MYKFDDIGWAWDRSRAGRLSVTVEAIAEVHETLSEVSVARACGGWRVPQMPNSTVRRIWSCVLHMFLYRLQHVQMLQAGDLQLQLDFVNEFPICYDSWSLSILWAGKAHLSFTGNVSLKNCMHWADNNSHDVAAIPLYKGKLTVYNCCITSSSAFTFLKRLLPQAYKRVW